MIPENAWRDADHLNSPPKQGILEIADLKRQIADLERRNNDLSMRNVALEERIVLARHYAERILGKP